MRALLIGAAEKKLIADLRNRASLAPLSAEFLTLASAGFDPFDPTTRRPNGNVVTIPLDYNIDIPDGFKVTYTEEFQPIGRCRHLSVSVDAPDKVPHPAAIQMLLSEFGFARTLGDHQHVYRELYGNGLMAINVIEQMEMADAD